MDASSAISHDGESVMLWSLSGPQPLRRPPLPEFAAPLDRLVMLGGDRVWGGIATAALSPDRRRVAIGGLRDVLVWERSDLR